MTRAAARLGIHQPPLSQQIKNLENELGVSLFARSSRRITLNAAGKVFLSDARRIVASVNEAVQRVRQFDLGEEGVVLIGLTSSASMHPRTIKIIEKFRSDHPLISLHIEEGANHDLLHLVEEERLDLAFVRTEVERYPILKSQCLGLEPMVVALPKNNVMATISKDRPISLRALADEDFVFFRQANGSGICDSLLDACARVGFQPRIVSECERIISAINMVGAGFGVAIVPRAMTALRLPSVVFRDLALDDGFSVPLNVAFRSQADAQTLRGFFRICDQIVSSAEPESDN